MPQGEERDEASRSTKGVVEDEWSACRRDGKSGDQPRRNGQLAPFKYLLEMASIYPPATDGSQTTTEEESLAQTLLRRLEIPLTPVAADEYEKECETRSDRRRREAKQGSDDDEPVVAHAEESEEIPVG